VTVTRSRRKAGRRPLKEAIDAPGMALTACVMCHFLIILDTTIVNVALPSIGGDLGGGVSGLQWIIDGYTLTFAALLLSSGALTDRFGPRQALTVGTIGFLLASVGCGLAPNMTTLIVSRFVQGCAAAIVMPATMAMITRSHPDPGKRARAVAIWAAGGAAAASSGLVLGGLFSAVSWRLIFLINVPVCLVALVLLLRLAPSLGRRVPIDWYGQIAAIIAVGAITFGAIESGSAGPGARSVISAYAIGAIGVVVFLAVQARGTHPMLPLELFRSRAISISVVIGFAYMAGAFGMPFVVSLYLQESRGLSPLHAGLTFLPMLLSGGLLTPFSAPLAHRVGARPLIRGGLALLTASLAALACAPAGAPIWVFALLMVPVGISGPLIIPPVTLMLLGSIPQNRSGVASATFNTSRQLGGALAVAVFGALLVRMDGFANGMRASFLIAAAAALTAGVISLRLEAK